MERPVIGSNVSMIALGWKFGHIFAFIFFFNFSILINSLKKNKHCCMLIEFPWYSTMNPFMNYMLFWRKDFNYYLFLNSTITFEYSLCARHWYRQWDITVNKNKSLLSACILYRQKSIKMYASTLIRVLRSVRRIPFFLICVLVIYQ